MLRPVRRLLATFAVLAAALAVPATAQTPGDPVRFDPSVAGKASHLIVDVRSAEDPQANGRSPQSVVMAVTQGFKFDPRARSERCSDAQAKAFDCPGNSKIGSGTANITASNGVFTQPLVADVQIFLAPPVKSGDAAGVVLYVKERSTGQQGTTTGRIVKTSGSFGLEVRFEDLAGAQQAPEGFTVRIDRFQTDVGASRYEKVKVCCKTVKKNGKKKKVKYLKKVRRDLIVNPKTCGGSWAYQVRLRYSATEESVRDGAAPCSASRR
jgi:hypothetical protein